MDRRMRKALAGKKSVLDHLKRKSRQRQETLKHYAATDEAAARPPRNDILPKLQYAMMGVDKIGAPERNVRKQDEAHVRQVMASIAQFGFNTPILIDENFQLIDGAIRLVAAKLLGLLEIPCIVCTHLSKAEKRTLRLALNRTQETGSWSYDDLKIEIEEIIREGEIPIQFSGFTPPEIDQILLSDELDGLETGPLEPVPAATPAVRLGDIFLLGEHRIVCADAREPDALRQLFDDGELARLIQTDVPYNVKIVNNVTSNKQHREFAMASGELSPDEYQKFNVDWMTAALPCLHDGGILGSFIDWRGLPTVHSAAMQICLSPINLVVWAKPNPGMGSLYRSAHELLPLFRKGNDRSINNNKLGANGRNRSNVWNYPGAASLGSNARKGLEFHPTVKPTEMLKDALLDVTNRGDIVLDPFLGSGSTLIAAEQTGRRCRGVEIDPAYIEVVIRRFEAATRKQAILESTGETFSDLVSRRHAERTGELDMDARAHLERHATADAP